MCMHIFEASSSLILSSFVSLHFFIFAKQPAIEWQRICFYALHFQFDSKIQREANGNESGNNGLSYSQNKWIPWSKFITSSFQQNRIPLSLALPLCLTRAMDLLRNVNIPHFRWIEQKYTDELKLLLKFQRIVCAIGWFHSTTRNWFDNNGARVGFNQRPKHQFRSNFGHIDNTFKRLYI